ncbi:hypothetical protein AK812_SmicGene23880 [Symbiodinium microadriaticum]|uniref:UBA domain-containing protein n=1 Tax=Symbiodinium microadriaticum TaxID=2951 RepID=A0A1Q9DG25_SYMMI|nr:hypothetical protein AK812_SmicGene23880 [Symbiodinium microadriaticum]CAE7742572.1 unnamed protein product [Symbiodinium sp. KB8]
MALRPEEQWLQRDTPDPVFQGMVAQFNDFDKSLQEVNSSLETFVREPCTVAEDLLDLSRVCWDPFRNLERDVENALLQNQLEVREQELWNERERSLNEQRLMAEVEVERPPKRRQSFCSTQAPDDEHGDQEVEDDECARDVSPAREAGFENFLVWAASCPESICVDDAQGEEQHVDDGQALAKPEDAEQRMCTDEGMMSIFAGDSERPALNMAKEKTELMQHARQMARLAVGSVGNALRTSSWCTSAYALIDHVAEMGSMERPESVVDFGEKVKAMRNPDTSFAAVFGGNVAQQKLYDCLLTCRWWCFALACKRRTHFAESHVQRIVGKNLRSLLWHCQSANDSISDSARQLLVYSCHASYVADGLPFAQRFIANYLLDLMENIVESHSYANLKDIGPCLKALAMVLRSMSKPQRQKWVSLLVQLLTDYKLPKENAQVAIWRLRMLWMADDDPTRTYAKSQHDLRTVAAAFPYNKDLAGDIRLLIHYSCLRAALPHGRGIHELATGVQSLSDGLAEQLKLAQDRILVTEGCRLREAAQNIARQDAPHSAVARFNRNMDFNITAPLKDHLANNEKLRKELEKRDMCLAALKDALKQVELCDAHALQDADLRRKLAKSEFQASKATFERINRSVFEWLYTLEEHRDDILDSCLQTLKHLQYDFLASAAHSISDVLPERMAFRRMTEMMPECLEAHVQQELRDTQDPELSQERGETFALRLVERLAREGKERPGAAPESAPSSQPVDPLSLSSLLSHGFEEGPARRALRQTGNDTQAAMDLLLDIEDQELVRQPVTAQRAALETPTPACHAAGPTALGVRGGLARTRA